MKARGLRCELRERSEGENRGPHADQRRGEHRPELHTRRVVHRVRADFERLELDFARIYQAADVVTPDIYLGQEFFEGTSAIAR